jgi:hypothetical protein
MLNQCLAKMLCPLKIKKKLKSLGPTLIFSLQFELTFVLLHLGICFHFALALFDSS